MSTPSYRHTSQFLVSRSIFASVTYPRFPQHEVKSCTLRFSDQGYSGALTNPPTAFLLFLLNLPTGFCVRWKTTGLIPRPVSGLFTIDFQSSFPLCFCSMLLDWHNPKHTSNRNFHMSTSRSEQGTQRDHLLLCPAAHVDTYSAKIQTRFQQELTQRSVHITKGGEYHPCLLAAGLDQAYKR